ncbi:hypothetical protein [Candidatus Phytoplasma fraxini]|uniref:Uncharacterized protein n=1 Tax=Ash yellows phytoplasma TaxID=35780 RepID=A0ABZ2U7U1_ASHYP
MKKQRSLKEILNENPKVVKEQDNQIIINYQEAIKNQIQTLPELKGLVYDKDYHEEDLITIENYLKTQKETPFGYQLVLKTKPYFQIVYRETDQSLFHRFQNNFQKNHSFFNQSLDLEKLKDMNIDTFERKIVQKYWKEFENEEIKPSLYLYGDFNTGKTFFFKLIIKYFLKKQQDFLFLFLPDLPRQFKSGWFDEFLNMELAHIKKKIN